MATGDHDLAAELAAEAGQVLLALRLASGFGSPESLRNAGDRDSHNLLVSRLHATRPDDAVLSEEGDDDERRLAADRVWIIDPLDGTREFAEAGRDDWAVHVALWTRGELTAGAVALPASGRTISTARPPSTPAPQAKQLLRFAVSRTRPPTFVNDLAANMHAELVPMGSAGAKVAAVVLGDVDAYIHDGGQYEWDSAAPVAVARAVGLHASRLDGTELAYNRPNPYLPDLLVCRPELATRLVKVTADLQALR